MELTFSLPPDFAALVDPMARGPAPLLRSAGAERSAEAEFSLLLGLLTDAAPGGEAWPPTGNELPVLPVDATTANGTTAELAASAVPAFLPAVFAVDPLRTGLPVADAPLATLIPAATAAEWLAPHTDAAAVPTAAASSDASTSDALATQTPTDADPFAALSISETQQPLEAVEPQVAAATVKAATAPGWLEAFGERRLQRSLAATPTAVRRGLETASGPLPVGTPAAVNAQSFAAAGNAPTFELAQDLQPRAELATTLASSLAAAESPSTGAAEWLPPAAAAQGTSTSAATSATPAVPGAPVDVRSPNWQDAFANRVQWLVDTQVGEAHIKLNPPELGAVDVKISLVDDKTYVQLTTATAAARDELAQSLPRLRELFTASGLELGGASVHDGRDGRQAGDGHGEGHGRPADGATSLAAPLESFVERNGAGWAAPRTVGRIDVFA